MNLAENDASINGLLRSGARRKLRRESNFNANRALTDSGVYAENLPTDFLSTDLDRSREADL